MLLLFVKWIKNQDRWIKNALLRIQLQCFSVGPGRSRFKLSFIVVFFRMVHKKKVFRRSSVTYMTSSEDPTWKDLFPLYLRKNMKSRHKFSKNYSTHGKNCEISGPNNFSLAAGLSKNFSATPLFNLIFKIRIYIWNSTKGKIWNLTYEINI